MSNKRRSKQLVVPPSLNGAPHVLGVNKWGGEAAGGIEWEVHRGDAKSVLAKLDADRFKCVVTSPPYYSQRDYEVEGQIGLEKTIDEYVRRIVETFDQVKRVLAPDGTLFLNLGDTYYSGKGQPHGKDKKNGARRHRQLRPVDASGLGVPKKTAIGIPWRVALAMIDKGWTLRCPIVWLRNGSIPEPTAHDRPWRTYEMVFLFAKSLKYHFRRRRLKNEEDVWTISNRPKSNGVHFATFPDELVKRCLDVGCPAGGEVLDPFAGAGTVLRVAVSTGRPVVGIDLSDKFCQHIVEMLGLTSSLRASSQRARSSRAAK